MAGRRIIHGDGQGVALRLLLGVASSRRIAQRLHEDIAFRVLAANNTPDFRTICRLSQGIMDAPVGPVRTGTGVVSAGGAVKLGHVALDGTKVKANASKHIDELPTDSEKAAQLAAEVAELLRQPRQRMMRKTGGTWQETSVEMSCQRSWPFESVGWRRYGKPWRRWKPRRRRLLEQAEAEGEAPRGARRQVSSVTSPIPSRAIPAPGERTSCKRTYCQAVVDSAHQVMWRRGPPTRLRISNRLRR